MVLARHDVNKNLPALFRGVSQLQRRYPQWRGVLRIVGRNARQTGLVEQLHRQLPRKEQVELIDGLSQEQLVSCLRTSMALLSASTEEGFDYPVLEAGRGHSAVISSIPVHQEFHAEAPCSSPWMTTAGPCATSDRSLPGPGSLGGPIAAWLSASAIVERGASG